MDRLEQIEKLRERAQVTYDEARAAYDEAGGDLLDALIILERQGKVAPPKGDGYYRSEQVVTEPIHEEKEERSEGRRTTNEQESTNNFKETLDKIWKFFSGLIKKGNETSFEVLKEKEHMASFPVTVLALLLVFAPWITLPLIVIGLFFGFHYQFVSNDEE